MSYQCHRCSTPLLIGFYVQRHWEREATAVRCARCGAVHTAYKHLVDVISPVMAPIDAQGRVSPWMLPWTRPIEAGWYECRFADTEPRVLRLYWDGAVMRAGVGGQRVQMRTFLSWRGKWLS